MSNSKLRKWTSHNKLLIFFILAALSLFMSTVALATVDREACTQLIEDEKLKAKILKEEKNATHIEVGA